VLFYDFFLFWSFIFFLISFWDLCLDRRVDTPPTFRGQEREPATAQDESGWFVVVDRTASNAAPARRL